MITRKHLPRTAALLVFAASLLLATTLASAHAKLESTTPTAGATVAAPKTIQAHFNEAIEIKLSSLKLALSDGTAVPVMSVNDALDPATLSIMPREALKPGSYKVTWSVVSDDGHKTHGTFDFTVQ